MKKNNLKFDTVVLSCLKTHCVNCQLILVPINILGLISDLTWLFHHDTGSILWPDLTVSSWHWVFDKTFKSIGQKPYLYLQNKTTWADSSMHTLTKYCWLSYFPVFNSIQLINQKGVCMSRCFLFSGGTYPVGSGSGLSQVVVRVLWST